MANNQSGGSNAPSQESQNQNINEKSYQPTRAQDTIRIGGRGPGRNLEVEKPRDGRQTLGRLLQYFSAEKGLIAGLLLVVVFLVLCSV
ncbi:MAG: hypothetical protein LUH58_05285, partial [Lachnospiraceae bacterium]|nr:hypothetical protein [Lachnospiraceae bacterium]